MSKNSKNRRQTIAKRTNPGRATPKAKRRPGPAKTSPNHGKKNTWYAKLKGTAPVGPTKPSKQDEASEE
jgi:hypothetical protein